MKNTKSAVEEKKVQHGELAQIRQEHQREKKLQYMRSYYEANKEKYRQYMHSYYRENRDKLRNYMHAYYEENKEKFRQYRHAYLMAKQEKRRQNLLTYQMANKEILSLNMRAHQIANREKLNKYSAEYYKTNKQKHFITVDNYRYSERNKPITSTERYIRSFFRRRNPVANLLVQQTGFYISDYFKQFNSLCINLFGEIKPYSEIGKSIKLSFGQIYSFPDATPLSVIFDPQNIRLMKKQIKP